MILASLYYFAKIRPHSSEWYNTKELFNHSLALLYILCHLVLSLTEIYPPAVEDPNTDLRLGIKRFLLAILCIAFISSLGLILASWFYGVFSHYRELVNRQTKIEFIKTLSEYLEELSSQRQENDNSLKNLL